MNNRIEITDVIIFPLRNRLPESKVLAFCRVILSDEFILHGIKIIEGEFGCFVAFPSQSEGSPYKMYDCLSLSLRKRLQSEVLKQYSIVIEDYKQLQEMK